MDLHCTTCGEPWDVYHLRHEAIFDVVPADEAEAWRSLPQEERLSPRYRESFKEAGFEFGQSVLNVVRCPACPKDGKPNPEKSYTKGTLEEILGDDEDGLAASFEDFRL